MVTPRGATLLELQCIETMAPCFDIIVFLLFPGQETWKVAYYHHMTYFYTYYCVDYQIYISEIYKVTHYGIDDPLPNIQLVKGITQLASIICDIAGECIRCILLE